MAHLVEDRVARVGLQRLHVGVPAVHGLGAQEEAPPARAQAALDPQHLVQRRLGGPRRVPTVRRPALGRQPEGHGHRLHERGLARAVLPDQERHARREVEPVVEHLRHRRDVRRPPVAGQVLARHARARRAAGRSPRGQATAPRRHPALASARAVVEAARRRDRGRRPGRAREQPRPGLLPGVGRHQARPRRVLPRRRPRHRQRALRAALHAAPVPEGPGRRQGAPEAAARRARRRGWRPCGCTSRAGTAPPTSCASPSSAA